MKMKLFLLLSAVLLCTVLLPARTAAQACTGLNVTYTTAESRCMSTGSINVSVSGGSGSYNYKAEGPTNTAFTSSSIITGLPAGTYNLIVKDITNNCLTTIANVVVQGSYQDPRFTLSGTNVTCAGNDGTIAVNDKQYGRSPFTYSIIAPSPAGVGTTNTTGLFSNLVAGEYAIQLRDSCGGIQVRRITIEGYGWSMESPSVSRNCNTASVVVKVKDNKGILNTASPASFAGFEYGVVNEDGTISWQSSPNFTYNLGKRRYLEVVAKDPCGNIKRKTWKLDTNDRPSITGVNTISNTCSTFTATVTGQKKLTSPYYNLYDQATNALVANNSTGSFANLAAGSYCVEVVDVCFDTTIRQCFNLVPPVLLLNTPVITDRACATFTASITPANFTASNYCLYDAGGNEISCNTEGKFPNLAYGKYTIKVTDACSGAVLEKEVDEPKPIPIINTHSVSGLCNSYILQVGGNNLNGAEYCLYDAGGNKIACNNTGVFENIAAGNYCIRAVVCGEISNNYCIAVAGPHPTVDAEVTISNRQCATFTATVTGQNYLTNPLFELIDKANNDAVIATNTIGVFDNIPYGNYCIKLTDGCNGYVIERCFAEAQAQPTVNPVMQQSNAACATFTATVTGANLINPQYALYNAADQPLQTNTTGVFNNLAWGTYSVVVTDGCTGKTFKITQTFTFDYTIALSTSKTCAIGEGTVTASFTNGFAPYTVNVYNPDGTLKETKTASTSSIAFTLPLLAPGLQYTVTATDNCGRADTKTIAPDAMVVTKSFNVVSKCPSSIYQNGSGNIVITASSNYKAVTPKIISRDGVNYSKSYASSGNVYTFSDLAPGTYRIEYSIVDCDGKMYDTITVDPYSYPTQGQSAIYQCDNNSFSLNADVSGGIGPYNYQIIGSDPESPSIVTAEQSSPAFTINNGTTYSLIRLRTIDACGNATLNDVSVLPLQNIVMKASNDCFYNEVILSVDTIPNATYQWFKKTGINDSTLLTTELTYNLPYMRPENVGTYVARITINDGCLVRVARYTLDGDCGHTSLPGTLQLKGKKEAAANVLSWQAADGAVVAYTIERKAAHDTAFGAIATLKATNVGNSSGYKYTDGSSLAGTTQYRLKWTTAEGKAGYSNNVSLQGSSMAAVVYPNPVTSEMQIAFSGAAAADYNITLHNVAGQQVYATALKQITTYLFRYSRPAHVQRGMYLLKIVNTSTGETVHHKILFN